jgi:hypothetical protein
MTATGTFKVKLTPQDPELQAEYPMLGRFILDKEFQGDLVGVGKGQMLSTGTAVKNSAGYVAIEQVTGSLGERTGSFVFQHSSSMVRGEPQQSIQVVADSGTGALEGLTGSFTIQIAAGVHSYIFEYQLPS